MTFSNKLCWILLLSSSLFIQASLAAIVCDDLPKDVCAFSIASSGKRCSLEEVDSADGKPQYECRTSNIEFERMAGHVEKEKCIEACGVDRKSVGISSDSLHNPQFLTKLCSPDCHKNCPNIVDYYFNLATGQGSFFPDLCQKKNAVGQEGEMTGQLSSSTPATPAASPKSSESHVLES